MAIISHSKRFIFIHIPKTGGTSISNSLIKLMADSDIQLTTGAVTKKWQEANNYALSKHSTSRNIQEFIGSNIWNDYFKFAIVRNPFSRTYSLYNFLKIKFRNWPDSEIMDTFHSFDDFVHSDFFLTDGPGLIFRPQVSWLLLDSSHSTPTLGLDAIGHLENLEKDFNRISENFLEIAERPNLPFMNKSSDDGEWISMINEGAKEIIRIKYKDDFEFLNYSNN